MAGLNSRSDSAPVASVILAAGDSTRMKSALNKVLHPLAGTPMIVHVVKAVSAAEPERIIAVVGRNRRGVENVVDGLGVDLVNQDKALGTAHALLSARELLESLDGDLLVTCGDTPLISQSTILKLLEYHRSGRGDATLLTCFFDNPEGYGRIIRAEDGSIRAIVEEIDATEAQREVREVNTGIYCFRSPLIFPFLQRICAQSGEKEHYLTDIVEMYNREGLSVKGVSINDEREVAGINTRSQLAAAENTLRERIREHWMGEGVTLVDPSSIFIDMDVEIGKDTTIYPHVIVEGKTVIGERTVIGPFCRVVESRIGSACSLTGWNFLEGDSLPDKTRLEAFSKPHKGC